MLCSVLITGVILNLLCDWNVVFCPNNWCYFDAFMSLDLNEKQPIFFNMQFSF